MKRNNPYSPYLQMWRWLIVVGVLNSALIFTSAPDALRALIGMFVPVDFIRVLELISLFANNIFPSIVAILLLSVVFLYSDKLTAKIGVTKPIPKILLNLLLLLITTLLIELLTKGYWISFDFLKFVINPLSL